MSITPHDFNAFIQFASPMIEQCGEDLSWSKLLEAWRNQRQSIDRRTPLVKRLDELRSQFINDGGKLLSDEEIRAEVRHRRGGVDGAGE